MLGWLRKKVEREELESSLSAAFSKIKEDLYLQKKFLDEMHGNHLNFKRNTTNNHARIAEWIVHFDKSIKRLERDLVTLEKKIYSNIEVRLNQSVAKAEENLKVHKDELLALKDGIKKDLEVFAAESKLKTQNSAAGSINNVHNANNVTNVTAEPAFEALSNPEKWLVGVLFNSETPLSYSQIAEKTGKTISTVRVYMNQLKFKGFVEESTLPNGVKIFSLKHKAKVKKLYNL